MTATLRPQGAPAPVTATEPTCAATPGCQRYPAPGLLTCLGHVERLGVILRDIEEEAAHLDPRPSMEIRQGSGGGSLAAERAPARLDVLAFRDPRTRRWEPDAEPRHPMPAPKAYGPWCLFCDHETCTDWRAGRRRDLHDDEHDAGSANLASALDELHNWARLVREERSLSLPEQVTVTGERDLLTRQLMWCAEQPWIDEMISDLTRLLGQLRRTNGTIELPAGTCSTLYDTEQCAGKVWHILIRHDNEPDEPGFRCGTCGRVWTGTEAVRKRNDMWIDEQKRKSERIGA